MADISQIKLPNGDTFDLVDEKSGYLTTETDPVFSASAAAGISATDISNWNKKSAIWSVSSSYNDDYGWWDLTINRTALHNISNAPGSNGQVRSIKIPNYGYSGTFTTIINSLGTETNKNLTLPSTSGTIALKSDIPTIPTNVSSFTNDSGYLTLATLPIYDGTVE